ncbi:DUF6338 family protein [Brucella intermedia]|uniref:DUF6338 family protein n=1 Tax=Brucella intermedia TaxID=94625 RepID=UPI003AB795A2
MTPSLFLIQIAILLLPGVIWARLDASYGKKKNPSQFEFVIRSVLFGLTSYAITYLLYSISRFTFEVIDLSQAEKANVISKSIVVQVAVATFLGLVLSLIWLYFVNYKIFPRFLQKIGATKTYGDEDVWDFMLNSSDQSVLFVHIRDFEFRFVYAGWVRAFSETGKLRELVLTQVDVYDFDGNLISSPPRLYIARKPEGIHIEFPLLPKLPEDDLNDEQQLSNAKWKKPWLEYQNK